ncbi:Holliday junction resolvase [Citrus sinensis]|nr:Holliday junction resolvase [Citrus sinensis]
MERKCSSNELQSLIESIKSSECMLNKNILGVAAKYVDSDLSDCLVQYLNLGIKASVWCGKHLKMTRMSQAESQEEEHCSFFFQVVAITMKWSSNYCLKSKIVIYEVSAYTEHLLSDFLIFSAASFTALMRYPISENETSMTIVEKFTLEQLSLTKDAISESKIINSVGLDILKVAQAVIDAVIRLCKEYSQSVNWESCDAISETEKVGIRCEEPKILNHVASIAKFSIQKLCELGILAANGGGSLVTILNVSWKGVVTLLLLGKGTLAVKVNVADIIATLISLVNESLRCAADAWSSLKEPISVNDARRIFIPMKFYLINAVKIASLFPSQAYLVYKEISLCVFMISTLRVSLSLEKVLKVASEVLVELLEKLCLDLLNSLLNSDLLGQELKLEILDWLFTEEYYLNPVHDDPSHRYRTASIDEIFSLSCEALPGARALLPGRVVLFLSFLMYSSDLEEDVKLAITRKLGWFLDVLTVEEVYAFSLASQIPVLYGSGKSMELVWEPLLSALLHALKTFMIVVSSCPAWEELMSFLLENFFHPHFACWEIIMELWCFLVSHAEVDLMNDIIVKLCALMKSLISSESVLVPGSTLRKMARSISILLTYSRQSVVDKVYNHIVGDDRSQSSSIMYVALLLEGFPVNMLSENLRSLAKQKLITDYFSFIERFDDTSLSAPTSGAYGVPVFALSASLQSLQVSISDTDMKTLKFLVAIIHRYRNPAEKLMKDHYSMLLSEILGIILNMKYLYASDEMDKVIFELQGLFNSGQSASDVQLLQCKSQLVFFMAGCAHMKLSESDDCAKSCAVRELYHMLFRERHWNLIHLALVAFGYFAQRTACDQLWKFMIQDAALSYDLVSGTEPNMDRFMLEIKAFLDKDLALHTVMHSAEQIELLMREGQMLRKRIQTISNIELEPMACESMEIDEENQSNKRRKLPDGICKGMELLQNGLKVIGDGISQWQQNKFDSTELQEKFLTQLSRLEDAISQLVGLTDSGCASHLSTGKFSTSIEHPR